MHTVHFPKTAKNGIIAAAMGIFFSTDRYDDSVTPAQVRIIDDFFDSLKWNVKNGEPTAPKVTYGDLMMMVNMRNRWSYKGSVTTPPCATTVYWNVVKTIYPLKQRHLDQFKDQMQRGLADGSNVFASDNVSNFRLIQDLGDRVIYDIEVPEAGSSAAGVVILLLILIGICVAAFIFHKNGRLVFRSEAEAREAQGEKKEQEFTDVSKAPANPAPVAEAAQKVEEKANEP